MLVTRRQLAGQMGLSERTLDRHADRLERAGFVEPVREAKGRQPALYIAEDFRLQWSRHFRTASASLNLIDTLPLKTDQRATLEKMRRTEGVTLENISSQLMRWGFAVSITTLHRWR